MSNWLGDLCVACGACCMDVTEAPVTPFDLNRLSVGTGLSPFVILDQFVFAKTNELVINTDGGHCQALSFRNGKYLCAVYSHRPEICREFVCDMRRDAEEWLAFKKAGRKVSRSNVFHRCLTELDVRDQAFKQIPHNWSMIRTSADDLLEADGDPEIAQGLRHTADGCEFDAQFPPDDRDVPVEGWSAVHADHGD